MKRKCQSAKDAESSSDDVLFLDGKLRPHKALTQPDATSSMERHVSHMLSDRLSSRCMGWSPIGAEQIARMRTYRRMAVIWKPMRGNNSQHIDRR